jgi:hypothetical protein
MGQSQRDAIAEAIDEVMNYQITASTEDLG